MPIRVAIADPLPIFRQGMQLILSDAGLLSEPFDSPAPGDLRAWLGEEDRKVVLLTLNTAADWELLADLHHSQPTAVLIAVLEELGTAEYARAVAAGAVAAVRRDAEPQTVCQVLRAAVEGHSLLPIDVLRLLVSRRPLPGQETDMPAEHEVAWLRQLSRGVTVARLAAETGYSERMMFRLLRDLYLRIGVRTRAEALLRAHERGWLRDHH